MFKLFTVTSILLSLCVFYLNKSDAAPASSSIYLAQKLQPREGYVPVFIRFGDTPLFAINPDLAAAFQETEVALNEIESNNKKHFDDENGSRESNEIKKRQSNANNINALQDENKDKKSEKIKN